MSFGPSLLSMRGFRYQAGPFVMVTWLSQLQVPRLYCRYEDGKGQGQWPLLLDLVLLHRNKSFPRRYPSCPPKSCPFVSLARTCHGVALCCRGTGQGVSGLLSFRNGGRQSRGELGINHPTNNRRVATSRPLGKQGAVPIHLMASFCGAYTRIRFLWVSRCRHPLWFFHYQEG